jgi:HK97 family phage major capsid protein
MADIMEKVDEVVGLVTKSQKRQDEINARGQKNEERLEALVEQVGQKTEEIQQITAALEAEQKAREELEVLVAQMPEKANADDLLGDPEYAKSFLGYLRRNDLSIMGAKDAEGDALVRLSKAFDPEDQREIKALSVGSNPDGGFLVPIDMTRKIVMRIFETSPMRQVAEVMSTANEAIEIVLDDQEAGTNWVGENEARTETATPQLGTKEIPTHEITAEPHATQKILDDAGLNIDAWLNRKIADKMRRQENYAFVLGTGVKQPRGFLTYGEWSNAEVYERDALATIQTTNNDALDDADDLIDLQALLLEEYQPGANWMMHRKIWANVIKLKDGVDGQYLINPQLLFEGVRPQLLGQPVALAGDMPNAVTNGAKVIAYGNFGEGYTIVDRIGIRLLRDPYTTKGRVKFYTTKRVGGDVTNYQAIKILKIQ